MLPFRRAAALRYMDAIGSRKSRSSIGSEGGAMASMLGASDASGAVAESIAETIVDCSPSGAASIGRAACGARFMYCRARGSSPRSISSACSGPTSCASTWYLLKNTSCGRARALRSAAVLPATTSAAGTTWVAALLLISSSSSAPPPSSITVIFTSRLVKSMSSTLTRRTLPSASFHSAVPPASMMPSSASVKGARGVCSRTRARAISRAFSFGSAGIVSM